MCKKILLFLVCVYFLIGCRNSQSSIPTPLPEELNLPPPKWLTEHFPSSEEIIDLHSYESEGHIPEGPITSDLKENSICVYIWPILEAGDFFSIREPEGEFFPARVSLFIDGEITDMNEDVIMMLNRDFIKDENHMIIAHTGGPYILCWPKLLEKGTHTATIQLERTSGIIESYSWSFTLTD